MTAPSVVIPERINATVQAVKLRSHPKQGSQESEAGEGIWRCLASSRFVQQHRHDGGRGSAKPSVTPMRPRLRILLPLTLTAQPHGSFLRSIALRCPSVCTSARGWHLAMLAAFALPGWVVVKGFVNV